MKNIKKFIDDIENTYNNISIHRAIIIVKNISDVYFITQILKKFDHSPVYLEKPSLNENNRLFITTIDHLDIIKLIDKKFYNFIASYKNIFIC